MNLLGLEYKIISNYIILDQPLSEMKETLAIEIRRTAKRQLTWFRGFTRRGIRVNWLKDKAFKSVYEHVQNAMKSTQNRQNKALNSHKGSF